MPRATTHTYTTAEPVKAFAAAFIAQPYGTRSEACEEAMRLILRGYLTVRDQAAAREMLARITAELIGPTDPLRPVQRRAA